MGLVVALFLRPSIGLTVAPVRNPTYVMLSDGAIRNTYDIRLRNQNPEDRDFAFSLTADAPLSLLLEGGGTTVRVRADEIFLQRVYVTAPAGSPAATRDRSDLRLWVEDMTNADRAHQDTVFNGKEE